MDLMSLDVRAIGSLDDNERINRLRSVASG
jgi:hypothetical protein